jgi:SAM-dependent methyltransferase
MACFPPLIATSDKDGSQVELFNRVERERVAHQDDHIEKSLSKWRNLFPHVFMNPSTKAMNSFYEVQLSDVRDRVILECGCGPGGFAAWLHGQGAYVVGIDISEYNISRCRYLFASDGSDPSRYRFFVMDAHCLRFPDQSFDVVVGNGILHHLSIPRAVCEINRVLKPGGIALFQEPMSGNPLLTIYRRLARFHTSDERPLTRGDIAFLESEWGFVPKYTGLITMPVALFTSLLLRPFPGNWFLYLSGLLENALNSRNILNSWNRFVILVYRKLT